MIENDQYNNLMEMQARIDLLEEKIKLTQEIMQDILVELKTYQLRQAEKAIHIQEVQTNEKHTKKEKEK
jgi:hypothetical protein